MADREDFATAVGAQINNARWFRGSIVAGAPVNAALGSLRDGEYRITSDTIAAGHALPFGRAGKFSQVSLGTYAFQVHQCVEGDSYRVWRDGPRLWGSWVTPARAYTDAAIATATTSITNAVTWYRGGLAADAPINGPIGSIPDGEYRITYDSRAAELGITGGGAGSFAQVSYGTFGFQTNTTLTGTVARTWRSDTSSWGDWYAHGGGTAPTPASDSASSGMKRIPLALTLGHGGGLHATTAGTVRFPMRWGAPVYRWRIHIRNANVRDNEVEPGAVSFPQGIWIGTDRGGGIAAGLARIVAPFSTPANGDEYITGWINRELPADSQHLLSWAYSASANVITNVGGNWSSTGNVADSTAGTWAKGVMAPLDFWIEAETSAATPVVAVVGDSLSAGTGSTLPVHDSALSQYMRAQGGLPIHYASVGDSLSIFNGAGGAGTDTWKKERWQHLAKPDAVLFAMASNDIFGGAVTLATVQSRLDTALAWVKANLSDRLFFSTITPRTGVTGAQEDVRRAYNAYLRTRADNIETFDFAAAISTDDEDIRPEYDADTIHLTTSGYAAEAATLRHLTSPAPIGRATIDALAYDSGLRDVSSLLANGWTGTAYLQRTGGNVILRLEGVTAPSAGNTVPFVFPVGFQPRGTSAAARGLVFTTAPVIRRYDVGGAGSAGAGVLTIRSHVAGEVLYGEVPFKTVQTPAPTPPGSAA